MTNQGIESQLHELFSQTAEAHHQAFIETDGEDPEWPAWYAEHLVKQLNPLFGTTWSPAELEDLIKKAEKERATHFPDADWKRFYAEYLLERYS